MRPAPPERGTSPARARCLALSLALASGCGPADESGHPGAGKAGGPPAAEAGVLPSEIASCARCHLLPPPEILTKERWPRVLRAMGEITNEYPLQAKLSRGEVERAIDYYVARAPEELSDADPPLSPSPLAFRGAMLGLPPPPVGADYQPPLIGNLELCDLDRDGWQDVLVSDIRRGALTWIHQVAPGRFSEDLLAEAAAPARIDLSDLDGDGDLDIALASLGGIVPTEEPIGSIVLLLSEPAAEGGLRYVRQTVLEHVPRVCDVRTADLDLDGDLDLAFSMFGLYKTGGAGWLERREDGGWKQHVILQKNGVSHVPVADLDRDGRPDVLALVSQEHEEIVLFVNRGAGRFEPYLLFKAPHVMFGLSNCTLCDLDSDGDLDVVFTNGDALDQDPWPKPWHGVHWLENKTPAAGRPSFAYSELARFPGAYCQACGDLDGDGDPDVVVGSMLNRWGDPGRLSLLWLENRGDGTFPAHPLDTSPTHIVTVGIGDLDADGRSDVVAGGLYVMPPFFRVGRVTSWTGQ